ncbi:MAG: NifB/NifX family molybdenum-iron cluster-binding protein [Candidatus Bathyarchaeia archaeon]
MKVAIVTDDGKTISQHFGRAMYYQVYEIRDGAVVGSEKRSKAGHHVEGASQHEHGAEPHGHHHGDAATHNSMLANVADCEALIARGMGWGAYDAIKEAGLKPYITDTESADEAVKAYIEGKLDNHAERLH